MQSKNTIIGIIVAAVILLAVIGGYFLGARSGRQGSVYSSGRGAASTVSQPVNQSSLLEDLEARLAKNPDDPEILLTLADTYFNMKRFEEAVKYYKQLSVVKPGDVGPYNEMGLSFYYMGKSAEGLKYVEEGIKKNPYHQRIWLTKGFILAYGTDDLDAAKEAWKRAQAIDPGSRVGKAAADYLAQINKTDINK